MSKIVAICIALSPLFFCVSIIGQTISQVEATRKNVAKESKDYEKLIGGWSVVSFEKSQKYFQLVRPKKPSKGVVVCYPHFLPTKGDVFTLLSVEQRIFIGGQLMSLKHSTNSAQIYGLDSSKTPKQIDIESLFVQFKGCPDCKGIYKFEEDELVCVFSVAGQPRPRDFSIEKEKGQFSMRMKKLQK